MNLLLVNYEFPPVGGGAATATRSIGRAHVAAGHRVAVLTTAFGDLPEESVEDGMSVVRVGARRRRPDRSTMTEMASFLRAGLRRVADVAERHGVEGCVAFFSVPCGPIALRLRRRRGTPYVVSLRGADVPGHDPSIGLLHGVWRPFRRRVLREAAAVVANSASLAQLARAADGVAVEVVPNGVDAAFFSPGEPRGEGPGRPFRLLFVGRLHAQKNPRFVLAALAALRRAGGRPVALDVVGDGPEAQALRDEAERLGVAAAVTWHGWLDRAQLVERYRAADCLVNASPREGMPNVVLEAMACGLPVLASRAPGHEGLVAPGETGAYFGLDSTDELVAAARALIDDPAACGRLGQAARRLVVERFTWERVAESYVALLRRAAPRSAAS